MKVVEPTADLSQFMVAVTKQSPRQEVFVPLSRLMARQSKDVSAGPQPVPDISALTGEVKSLREECARLKAISDTPPPVPKAPPAPIIVPAMSSEMEETLEDLCRDISSLRRSQAQRPDPAVSELAPKVEGVTRAIEVLSKEQRELGARLINLGKTVEQMRAPPPPPPPMAGEDPAIKALRQENHDLQERLAALEARVQQQGPITEEEDLPNFLRKMQAAAPSPAVVGAVDVIARLEKRIDALAAAVDQLRSIAAPWEESIPQAQPADYSVMHNLLQSMQEQIAELTKERAAEPEEPEGPVSLEEYKRRAIEKIHAAAARRRNALLGDSADARDLQQRLTEVALNSLTGRPNAIALLEEVSKQIGEPWSTIAERQSRKHDSANALVIQILCLELEAEGDIASADVLTHGDIDAITERVCEAIAAIGGENDAART